jgi:hypothetical protein
MKKREAVVQDFKLQVSATLKGLATGQGRFPLDAVERDFAGEIGRLERWREVEERVAGDKLLSDEGRRLKAKEQGEALLAEARTQHAAKLAGLDAHRATEQAAHLRRAGAGVASPSERAVDDLLRRLLLFNRTQRAALYTSASPLEQATFEAAARLVPRIPVAHERGGVAWEPFLDQALITEAARSVAATADPEGAETVAALDLIRDAYATIYRTVERILSGGVMGQSSAYERVPAPRLA